MRKKFTVTLHVLLLYLYGASAQTLTTSLFASGFSRVTDIQNAGDERLFIVEKAGRIKICNLSGAVNPNLFLNITSIVGSVGNEQGLLGLAFHPNYKNNRYFYVNYTNLSGHTVIARYQTSPTNPDSALPSSGQILMTINQPYSNHNGGSMNFGPDGYLYIATGDGGSAGDPQNNGQNKLSRLGKILRIDVDAAFPYAIPECNPFNNNPAYLSEIWAWGLRNPWRCSFDKMTGDFWMADVGQNAREEINFQPAHSLGGENYGWRCYEGNLPYNTNGCQPAAAYVFPVYDYPHSGNPSGCSVTGGYVYRGARYADLFGRYFFGDYCSGIMFSTDSKTLTTVVHGSFPVGTYNTFGVDVYGELYVALDANGQILKIGSANCNPVASFSLTDTLTLCGMPPYVLRAVKTNLPFTYEWYYNGSLIVGADSDTLEVTQPGNYSLKVIASPGCESQSPDVYVQFGTPSTTGFTGLPSNTCINYGPISLNGVPARGTFTGHGISGNQFDPAAAGIGTHCIYYTYVNAQGCTSQAYQSVLVEPCTGTEELSENEIFSIHPIPASEFVWIQLHQVAEQPVSVSLYDMSGRSVIASMMIQKGESEMKIPVQQLQPGLYLIRMNFSQRHFYSKLIIE